MKLLEALTEEEVLAAIPETLKNDRNEYSLVQEFHDAGIFAIPAWSWLRPLAERLKGKKCLEIMAGRGIISSALKKLGVDIIATDSYSWSIGNGTECSKAISKGLGNSLPIVERIYALDAIKKYDADVLICCWPADAVSDNSAFLDACMEFHKKNPSGKIIYIGENAGGCCANDEFFECFSVDPIEECFSYPTLGGLYDQVYEAFYDPEGGVE